MGIIKEPKNIDLVVGPSKDAKKTMKEMDELIRTIKERKNKRAPGPKEKSGRSKRAA